MKATPRHCISLAVTAATCSLLLGCGGGGSDPEAAAAVQGVSVTAAEVAENQTLPIGFTLPPLRTAPAGISGNVVCDDLRIGVATVDNVTVPAGKTCRLTDTTVRGSVQAERGAVVIVAGAVQIAGSLQGAGAAHVQMTGTGGRIVGNFQMEGGGSATLTGARVGGDVFVNGLTSVVAIRDANVNGNIQFTDNRGGGEITGNRVVGNLQCTGNLPAPLASNNTAALIEGQCVASSGGSGGGVGGGAGGGSTPTPPLSGNVDCVNQSIGAIRLDSVNVPAGATCTLMGTIMNGSVEVRSGAQLTASNVAITGNLLSDGAAALRLNGSSQVGGSIQIQRGAGAEITGARVTGNLQIDAMAGPVVATGNAVGGSLQAVGNRGGITLINNRMNSVLQCKENTPAPTGSGNTATLKEDQCVAL
jgi:hypothetical protein